MPGEQEKDIIIRTEEVNEILAAPPRWIFRWGISIVFIVIILGLVLSYFIRYPDTLPAQATITTSTPPVTLVSKTTGRLALLMVKNNEIIGKGGVLGVIENTADYRQVLAVEKNADTLFYQLRTQESVNDIPLSDTLKLGDITPQYLAFLKSYKDFRLFSEINPQQQEILILNKQLAEYGVLLSKYQKEETIYQEEFKLIEKDYNRDLNLYRQDAISARDFENKKKEYLASQRNFENQKIIASDVYKRQI